MLLSYKVGVAGTVLAVIGAGFGWGIFPWFLNGQIAKAKGLEPGTEGRQMWERVPFAVDFKIYLFNITNHKEVQEGELPMLDEIGPYYYGEWKEKVEVIDYPEDDTVSFHMKTTWIYDPKRTAPLTGDEVVVIPNPLIVGMLGFAERKKAAALGIINKAIPLLFEEKESIFLTTTVKDLLFGGVEINCTSKEFAAQALCGQLKKEDGLEHVSPTIHKFSIFGMKNGTADKPLFLVSRGIKDYKTVGEMVELNGKKKLKFWSGDPCNDLYGTDSTIFPPFFKPTDDIVSFAPDLCRSLGAKFVRFSNYKGISTFRYNASFGDQSTVPSEKCYCHKESPCLKRGVMDLFNCTGTPIIASLPHFYDAHEDYVKGVRGLRPDEEKHSIMIDLEPLTGSPIYAKKRMQFSLPIHKFNKVPLTDKLPRTIVPFMWVEEGVELDDELIAKLDGQLFAIIRAVDIIKWVITVLGGALVGGGIGIHYKKQNSLSISPTNAGNRKMDTPSEFVGDKKPQSGTDGGHDNFGYI